MSRTFKDRLDLTDAASLRAVLDVTAESDCVKGDRSPQIGCDCVCCVAARLRQKLWPRHYLSPARVALILDEIDDARTLFHPSLLIRAGVPEDIVERAKQSTDSADAVLGLSVIAVLAEQVGVDPDKVPQFIGWQRTMRATKAAIREKIGLPVESKEDDQ